MRRRTFHQRNRSRNPRANLSYIRYEALWRVFGYGQRRNYLHTQWLNGSRRQHLAMDRLDASDRRGVLKQTDPSGFHGSPTDFKFWAEPEQEASLE